MQGCDQKKVEAETQAYWDKGYDPNNPFFHFDEYIRKLLPLEMACAREYGKLPSLKETCEHLILLVGHSLEPLLQSIWAYNPKKVSLIVNKRYGPEWNGEDQAGLVKKLVKVLADVQQRPEPGIEYYDPIEGSPEAVFQALLKNVKNTENVIIDITGSKKSMVSGAFLFASLANVTVSYVDFDDRLYDPNYRRPFGYGCIIDALNNPYESFALRDWERMRELYIRYKFRDARILLAGEWNNSRHGGGPGTIVEAMKKVLPDSEPNIQRMADILLCYELWDRGDYNEAAAFSHKTIGFTSPHGVIILDGKWYIAQDGEFKGGISDFYEDTPEFRAYVTDEFARVERLIRFNQDYRSALLRAANLNEVMMLARLLKLMPEGVEKSAWRTILQKRTPNAEDVFRALTNPQGKSVNLKQEVWNRKGLPDLDFVIGQEMKWHLFLNIFGFPGDWERLIHRRNDLAHKYFSPPEEWAWDAYHFVKANIEDFWGALTEEQVKNTQSLPWSELCRLTGLTEYLPPNLLNDPKEDFT